MRKLWIPPARPGAPWRAALAGDDYGVTAEPDWRTIDWQAHLRQAPIEGRRVNYVDLGQGDGAPVVFVHGLGGQWQNWLENLPRIAQTRRVIALDLPGFGCSEPPAGELSIPAYGRTVDALCEELGLGSVAVVGNSMGGFVGAEVAIQFPARVERLVLVSAAGISSANVARAPAITMARAMTALATNTVAELRRMARRPGLRSAALWLVARYPGRLKPDLAFHGLMIGAGKPSFLDALRASLVYDFRPRLSEIGAPTLIVWGEDDMIIPAGDAHRFERLISDSRKVMLRETGHVPMAERPRTFNDLLLEFLEEAGPAEATEPVEAAAETR